VVRRTAGVLTRWIVIVTDSSSIRPATIFAEPNTLFSRVTLCIVNAVMRTLRYLLSQKLKQKSQLRQLTST